MKNETTEAALMSRPAAAKRIGVSLPTFDTWRVKGIGPRPLTIPVTPLMVRHFYHRREVELFARAIATSGRSVVATWRANHPAPEYPR
jgi:hypothetical protein